MDPSSDQRDPPVARPISAPPMVQYARAIRWRSANPLVVTQRWTTTVLDLSVACGGFIAVLLGLEVVAAVTFGGGLEGSPPSGWVLAAERGVLSLVILERHA